MHSRWSAIVAAIAVLVIGVGVFAKDASAAPTPGNPGPGITADAPAAAPVGGTFDFTMGIGATPAGTTIGGYQLGIIYDGSKAVVTGGVVGGTAGLTDLAPSSCPGWGTLLIGGGTGNDSLSGALPAPYLYAALGVAGNGAGTSGVCNMAKANFTAVAGPAVAIHMVHPAEDITNAGISTYTADAGTGDVEPSAGFSCVAAICGPVMVPNPTPPPAEIPMCTTVGCSQPWDTITLIQDPLPVLAITKSQSLTNLVAGDTTPSGQQTYTINVSQTSGGAATGVVVTDTIPAQFPIANLVGALPAGCSNVGQAITCNVADGSLPVSLAFTFTSDANAGGSSACNSASVSASNVAGYPPAPAPAVTSNQVCANIIPPNVAWSKSPTQDNLWLTLPGPNTYTFQEILTNVGDPNGLGGFSFDIHYDPTQYLAPEVDLAPAAAIFTAAGRTLDCSITIPTNGTLHIACASTGAFGVGPQWVGSLVMANVTLTPQDFLVEAIRPNKENGDVSTVKDDQVTVTNTCGQPLNDGSIQPIPGQPECQGNPLGGVGPGGVLTGNPNGGQNTVTIRRLEGDITGDCVVNVSDMQLEASKFGQSIGGLLYRLWYDVNSPLQHGDGEIDINDIQFVFGRNGSTCANPIPTQPSQAPLP